MGRRNITPPSFHIGTEAAEAIRFRENVAKVFYDEAMALACNAIKIDDHPAHIPQWFVLRTLFERGDIGYFGNFNDQATVNAFMIGGASGVDLYGVPLKYLLTPLSGQSFEVPTDSDMLHVIRANATRFKLADKIRFIASRIADCEVAISANLIHSQTTDFIGVNDPKSVTTLKSAMRDKMNGLPVVYVRKDESDAINDALSQFSTAGDFYADRIAMLRDQYKQELLAGVGTLSANKYKRERVQSSEVNAGVGEVLDNIYLTIDQYNHDCELAGLPYRMRVNSMVADLYTESEENANV